MSLSKRATIEGIKDQSRRLDRIIVVSNILAVPMYIADRCRVLPLVAHELFFSEHSRRTVFNQLVDLIAAARNCKEALNARETGRPRFSKADIIS